MKKILILSRKDDRESYDQKRTYDAALAGIETKCEYVTDEFEELLFVYDGTELKVFLSDGVTDIAEFDGVFLIAWFKSKALEDVALSTSVYLSAHNVKTFNSEALYTRSRSKLSQYVYAALNDIAMTPFIFSLNPDTLSTALRDRWSHGFPVIMKGIQASRGNDNYLVGSAEEAVTLASSTSIVDGPWFVLQQFVPNEGDYRIIVMGDQVEMVIHRQSSTGSHLNNTSKGGDAKLVDPALLPKRVLEDCVKLSKLLRREITGVDMIQHKDTKEFYLLEINNMPQLVTGSYVSQKITMLDAYLASL